MSEFNYKKEWSIPSASKMHEHDPNFEVPTAMVEAALQKIKNPLALRNIYTTLTRATDIHDVDSVMKLPELTLGVSA